MAQLFKKAAPNNTRAHASATLYNRFKRSHTPCCAFSQPPLCEAAIRRLPESSDRARERLASNSRPCKISYYILPICGAGGTGERVCWRSQGARSACSLRPAASASPHAAPVFVDAPESLCCKPTVAFTLRHRPPWPLPLCAARHARPLRCARIRAPAAPALTRPTRRTTPCARSGPQNRRKDQKWNRLEEGARPWRSPRAHGAARKTKPSRGVRDGASGARCARQLSLIHISQGIVR